MNTNSITVGDVVRVSKDAPRMYVEGILNGMFTDYDCSVEEIIDGNAKLKMIERVEPLFQAIPTKYLIKVEDEAKNEPKFKVGDKVKYIGVLHTVESVSDIDGWKYLIARVSDGIVTGAAERFLEPYTSPSEPKKPTEEADSLIHDWNELTDKLLTWEDLERSKWEAYTAQLAHDIAVKLVNKNTADFSEVGANAVKVAKAVVEGLKRK